MGLDIAFLVLFELEMVVGDGSLVVSRVEGTSWLWSETWVVCTCYIVEVCVGLSIRMN